jgi:TonB family protein
MALAWLRRGLLAASVGCLGASPVAAQSEPTEQAPAGSPAQVPAAGSEPQPAGGVLLTPPEPLEAPSMELPADQPPLTDAVEVVVDLVVDEQGLVASATVAKSGGEAIDRVVLAALRRLRFKPATQNGVPIAVGISFTQRFEPPPPAAATESLDAQLVGMVAVRGTRAPVPGATVVAKDLESKREYATTTDAQGLFALAVPALASLEVRVVAPDFAKFVQHERLAKDQRLKVKYLVDRQSYDEFETIVRTKVDRTEVSRTTLSGREVTRVAGTFGDPFRVINLLPGVSSVMSLLPLPVVRGSSPGDTGFLLDGIRMPLLFHLLSGPSVVHPELIDHVDFYPGGFPVTYGGYVGGIVDGVTRAPRRDERKIDLDLNQTQAGGFVREPVAPLGGTVTVAGRYGYPGLILSLLAPNVSLAYWDYQTRFDAGSERSRWSIFFYGAEDTLKTRAAATLPLQTVARFAFHRADLSYRHGDESDNELVRLILGYDDTSFGSPSGGSAAVTGGGALGNGSWSGGPQLRLHRSPSAWLQVNVGAESLLRNVDNQASSSTTTSTSTSSTTAGSAAGIVNQSGFFSTSGAFIEAVVKATDSFTLIPGVRGDLYDERRKPSSVTQWSVDPRLLARWRLTEADFGGTTLKGVVGRYHQPPRLFVPVPGLDASSLELGLLASTQYSVGVETKLGPGLESDVNVYYNATNPVLFDLATNPSAADVQRPQPAQPAWEAAQPAQGNRGRALNGLYVKRQGRAYGLEVLLRKRDSERLFGWVSYTLSRAERKTDAGWDLFDYDRLHILNFVAGVRLPRNWELGTRVLLQTGTPLTTIFGHNVTRSDGQFRVDLRVDKRAVWNTWLLDFYVDVINTTVAAESGGLVGGSSIRYIIPTIGLRGVL